MVLGMSEMKRIRENLFCMTQAQFAEAVGVNQSSVTRWDQGSMPKVEHLVKIANAAKDRSVKLDLAELVGRLNAGEPA